MTTSLVRSDNFIPFPPYTSRPFQGGFLYFFFAPNMAENSSAMFLSRNCSSHTTYLYVKTYGIVCHCQLFSISL